MIKGAFDIKNHRFFDAINWDDILHKREEALFKPDVSGEQGKNFGQFEEIDESKIESINKEEDPFVNW